MKYKNVFSKYYKGEKRAKVFRKIFLLFLKTFYLNSLFNNKNALTRMVKLL